MNNTYLENNLVKMLAQEAFFIPNCISSVSELVHKVAPYFDVWNTKSSNPYEAMKYALKDLLNHREELEAEKIAPELLEFFNKNEEIKKEVNMEYKLDIDSFKEASPKEATKLLQVSAMWMNRHTDLKKDLEKKFLIKVTEDSMYVN